jgi:NADPH:quinone reductase
VRVIATTRNPTRASLLQQKGAEHVVIDTGQIAEHVKSIVPGRVNGVLELVGATTLRDSLKAVAPRGIVCNSGILGNAWILDRFEPIVDIPSTVRLTVYTSDDIVSTSASAALQHIVEGIEQKRYDTHIDRIFHFHQIVEAHRYMEESHATGKIVVLVDE